MKTKKRVIINSMIIFLALVSLPLASAAHFIVGVVNDALDGTVSDGHTVILWNPTNGIGDNLTDIVGPTGNSGVTLTYMIDCHLLQTRCKKNDVMNVMVLNNGDDYIANYTSVAVSTGGFTIAPNLTLNSPPNVTNVSVDDSLTIPAYEIDLTPASTRNVTCEAIVYEFDGNASLVSARAEFFDASVSNYSFSDDNNEHYTNSSCYVNRSYGNENQSQVMCNFEVQYNANSDNWRCIVEATDNLSISGNYSNSTFINPLLAISVAPLLDFGVVNAATVSNEVLVNVTNVGNVKVNLSLSGFAVDIGDGLAMNCTLGEVGNISIENEKYNLTESTPGLLSLSQFEASYINLTETPTVRRFNLDYRQDEAVNEAVNGTYWRIYLPLGVGGTCSGNTAFSAVQSSET